MPVDADPVPAGLQVTGDASTGYQPYAQRHHRGDWSYVSSAPTPPLRDAPPHLEDAVHACALPQAEGTPFTGASPTPSLGVPSPQPESAQQIVMHDAGSNVVSCQSSPVRQYPPIMDAQARAELEPEVMGYVPMMTPDTGEEVIRSSGEDAWTVVHPLAADGGCPAFAAASFESLQVMRLGHQSVFLGYPLEGTRWVATCGFPASLMPPVAAPKRTDQRTRCVSRRTVVPRAEAWR